MKIFKAKCVICEKKIPFKKVKFGSGKGSMSCYADSEFGVLFYYDDMQHKWFCNECWAEIRKDY